MVTPFKLSSNVAWMKTLGFRKWGIHRLGIQRSWCSVSSSVLMVTCSCHVHSLCLRIAFWEATASRWLKLLWGQYLYPSSGKDHGSCHPLCGPQRFSFLLFSDCNSCCLSRFFPVQHVVMIGHGMSCIKGWTLIHGAEEDINHWISKCIYLVGFLSRERKYLQGNNAYLFCCEKNNWYCGLIISISGVVYHLKSDLWEKKGILLLCFKLVSPNMQLLCTQSQVKQMWLEETGEHKSIQ